MLAASEIKKTLAILDSQYLNTRNQRLAFLYSKLALLELCGWIEESIDELLIRTAIKNFERQDLKKFKKNIKDIHAFHYEKNFRPLLNILLSSQGAAALEKKIDPFVLQNFRSALNTLKPIRDEKAHTYTLGTPKIDAPSVTIQKFNDVYIGLKAFELKLRGIKVKLIFRQ